MPKGSVEALLKDIPKLKSILTYHVLPERKSSMKVFRSLSHMTMNGGSITTEQTSHGALVDGAQVVTEDIECSNGIIHAINKVILPGVFKLPEYTGK